MTGNKLNQRETGGALFRAGMWARERRLVFEAVNPVGSLQIYEGQEGTRRVALNKKNPPQLVEMVIGLKPHQEEAGRGTIPVRSCEASCVCSSVPAGRGVTFCVVRVISCGLVFRAAALKRLTAAAQRLSAAAC